ncbi:MAG: hypothetical protein IJ327_01655 [Lachnospiraceae bacterium]|nr:hypothetical protein [Lachnospiraceae bacterium]
MKFPIFASFIIFVIVVKHAIKKQQNSKQNIEESFWDRERRSNSVRRKSLEDLDYIKIPLDELPLEVLTENPEVAQCIATIKELADTPIVNLTGYSNTDLKLEYGTANITQLSQYDQSYTLLVSTLQKWAEYLYQAGFMQETLQILEFALSTGTDVSKTYYLLAELYISRGEPDKITHLIEMAQELRSINRSSIVRTLQEFDQSAD